MTPIIEDFTKATFSGGTAHCGGGAVNNYDEWYAFTSYVGANFTLNIDDITPGLKTAVELYSYDVSAPSNWAYWEYTGGCSGVPCGSLLPGVWTYQSCTNDPGTGGSYSIPFTITGLDYNTYVIWYFRVYTYDGNPHTNDRFSIGVSITPPTISYSSPTYCQSDGAQTVTMSGGPFGGTFSASPAGLTIDALSGTITPSTSSVGTYTVTYSVPTACGTLTATTTVTISAAHAVSVSIGASSNPVCSGSSVTLTATPTNGGAAPSYQWEVNTVPVGGNTTTYSYTPANGDQVKCILTSNVACPTGNPATSNTITITLIASNAVSVSIGASSNPVCSGTTVTFTATPTNGGAAPSYQWKVNTIPVGGNSTTYSYIPSNGDQIICILTSNVACPTGNPATSNTITMTVNATNAVSVSIGASSNPICFGTSVTFTATPTHGGAAPSYQWK